MDSGHDFSQNGEQPLILAYMERNPDVSRYCVDAGAYDGVVGSNSRALFLMGWSGVAIEPDPRTFARLSALYADRPDVRCVRRALSDQRGVARMHFSEGPPGTPPEEQWKYAQVNTFSRPFAIEYERNHQYRYRSSFVVKTSLTRLLREEKAPRDIGFMSIDCEGEDMKIITELDLEYYRPSLLCVESDDNSRDAFLRLLGDRGYEYHAHTVANTLLQRIR